MLRKRFLNKKIIWFSSIILLLFILTGCYSKEERELAKKYEHQAQINAINYVKNKYNLVAKVISAKALKKTSPLFPIPNSLDGNVMVKMKVDKKIFYVYITGIEKSNIGKDNYQQEQIEQDLITLIERETKIKQSGYYIEYPNTNIYIDFKANVISTYYNKNNLNKVLKNIGKLEMYYVGKNKLNDLNLNELSELTSNTKISLINFKSKEDYDNFIREKNNKNHGCQFSCEDRFIIYKDSSLTLNNGEVNYYKYNKDSYENEVYIYSNDLDDINIEISNQSFQKLKNGINTNNQQFKDKKLSQVSEVYSIPYTPSYLFIF